MNRSHGAILLVLALSCGWVRPLMAQQQASLSAEDTRLLHEIVEKGLNYLDTKGQAEDGTFSSRAGSGITALAVTAMLRNGRAVDDPAVAKGLRAMEGFVKPDGGIYSGSRLINYETCVGMLCFKEANGDGRYDEILKRAKQFVSGNQYGADDERDPSDPWYGGVGYGTGGRPDLSNTGYLIEALVSTEGGAADPAMKRALAFVSRCQNLESEFNDTRFAALVKDGGFYYEIPLEDLDPEESPDRVTPNGGLRSYGSMTYTGFKSMIFAGLTADDPRVKAALSWIGDHYTTGENPGMGSAGLYYYYHTFGAALKAAGIDQLTDSNNRVHQWRSDLIRELAKRQQPDGSWANENSRWFEDDKNLSTSFALLALAYCYPESDRAVDE